MSLATGCWTYIFYKMVAPSLVTVTYWSGDTSNLSKPLGPKDDLRVEAIDLAANIFLYCNY